MLKANTIRNNELNIEYQIPEDVILFTGNTDSYISVLKAMDKLPFSKIDIKFSDDVWDFTGVSDLNISKSSFRFDFKNNMGDSCFVDIVKTYVLLTILKGDIKIQTLHNKFCTIAHFSLFIEKRHVYSFEDVSEEDIKSFFTEIESSAKGDITCAVNSVKYDLRHFFEVYFANFSSDANPILDKCLNVPTDKGRQARKKQNRFCSIPEDYFDKMLSALITVSNDEAVPFYMRGTACAYIILSQTGLRAGEILGLKTNALRTSTIINGETVEYLEYRTWKRKKGNGLYDAVFTYINKISLNAYNLMMQLYEKRRNDYGLNYLYMGGRLEGEGYFPLSPDYFLKAARELFAYMDEHNLLKTANLPKETWPTLWRHNTKRNHLYKKDAFGNKQRIWTLTFPHTQHFRYHVCEVLAKKGVPIEYIRKFMAHLTPIMTLYHYNPQPKLQEDLEYSKRILKEIVTDEARPLSGDKGMTQKIREFIEENHYNIEKDLDTIVDKLAGKIPIRRKAGGCCIKSSQFRECSKDAQTNEFYCAYGVCPNIVHFYYTADVSYKLCKELLETIEINTKNGFRKQVQKERNMLNYIVVKRLQPEIEDLKRVIERNGVEHVFMMHPELKDIVENLESIEKEMTEWTTPQS